MRENVYTRKTAIELLKKWRGSSHFPCWRRCLVKKKGPSLLEEENWKPMLGRLINHSNCDVMITKFEGQNSKFFQIASRFNQIVRQSLYLYEIKKSLDKPMKFKYYKYLKNEDIPKMMTSLYLCIFNVN